MLKDYAAAYFCLGERLSDVRGMIFSCLHPEKVESAAAIAAQDPKAWSEMPLWKLIPALEQGCRELGLPMTLDAIRLYREAAGYNEPDNQQIHNRLQEVILRAGKELESVKFLFVSGTHVPHYEIPADGWEAAIKEFPEIQSDVEEANRCFALSRTTASVFHMMRVMEAGIRRLAARLDPTIDVTLSWGLLEPLINNAVNALPRTEAERKSKLAAAAAHFHNVRWAWRNETMHPKAVYSETEASEVLAAVRAFINTLATIV